MGATYFNHRVYLAESWWDRRRFIANRRRIYTGDPYWTPPYFPALNRALEPSQTPHLARQKPLVVHIEALPQRSGQSEYPNFSAATLETPVAAAVALGDPRRQDKTAYLTLLHCANDLGSLERLLDYLAETLAARGYRKLLGPVGLSPHLGSGLLQDYWNVIPPLHTPYDPPYMPELVGATMRVRSRSQLYRLNIPPMLPPVPHPAEIAPFEPARLANDLLPLFAASCLPWLDFPPPDKEEAAFLVCWVGQWPLIGWLAQVDAAPVGFVLLQPDLSVRLRRAKGGRNPLWRLWLNWVAGRPAQHGRLLFGGVLSHWRGQGIGRQLLHQAMLTAQQQGWQSLSIGPLPGTASAAKILEHYSAGAQQSYLIYQRKL